MKFKTNLVTKAEAHKPRRKIAKNVTTRVFGFPVKLSKAPQVEFEGEWVLDVDYEKVGETLIDILLEAHRPLTGAQMKFIRKKLNLTQEDLAHLLGKEQPHIARAEKKGNEPAFESYTDQFALILNLKAERVRQSKKNQDWLDEVFSAEDFEEDVTPVVTLRSA